jgi:Amino acid transporters
MGWNYWFNWAITIAVEITTAGVVVNFWLPNVPSWIFSAITMAFIFIINVLSVSSFGEAEYWMAIIKVITIIIFLIAGVCIIVGILGGTSVGFHNLTYKKAPFVGGFSSLLGYS